MSLQRVLIKGHETACKECAKFLRLFSLDASTVHSFVHGQSDQDTLVAHQDEDNADGVDDNADELETPSKRRRLPDVDVCALVAANPHLELLEAGSYNKTLPVRCLLCLGSAKLWFVGWMTVNVLINDAIYMYHVY